MKKTPWFPASVKPVRRGLYERRFLGGVLWSEWDGRQWLFADGYLSLFQVSSFEWRGLTEPAC